MNLKQESDVAVARLIRSGDGFAADLISRLAKRVEELERREKLITHPMTFGSGAVVRLGRCRSARALSFGSGAVERISLLDFGDKAAVLLLDDGAVLSD